VVSGGILCPDDTVLTTLSVDEVCLILVEVEEPTSLMTDSSVVAAGCSRAASGVTCDVLDGSAVLLALALASVVLRPDDELAQFSQPLGQREAE
jgi:hypothetical protein